MPRQRCAGRWPNGQLRGQLSSGTPYRRRGWYRLSQCVSCTIAIRLSLTSPRDPSNNGRPNNHFVDNDHYDNDHYDNDHHSVVNNHDNDSADNNINLIEHNNNDSCTRHDRAARTITGYCNSGTISRSNNNTSAYHLGPDFDHDNPNHTCDISANDSAPDNSDTVASQARTILRRYRFRSSAGENRRTESQWQGRRSIGGKPCWRGTSLGPDAEARQLHALSRAIQLNQQCNL
jgi:hypothetical protein